MGKKTIVFEMKPNYWRNPDEVKQKIEGETGLPTTSITQKEMDFTISVDDNCYNRVLDMLKGMKKYGFITCVDGRTPNNTVTFTGVSSIIRDDIYDKIAHMNECSIRRFKTEETLCVEIVVDVKYRKNLYAALNGIERQLR